MENFIYPNETAKFHANLAQEAATEAAKHEACVSSETAAEDAAAREGDLITADQHSRNALTLINKAAEAYKLSSHHHGIAAAASGTSEPDNRIAKYHRHTARSHKDKYNELCDKAQLRGG